MSSGEVRRVSCQDIQLVQNLIERCLQLYMSRKEVMNTLLQQAKIEPGFTELVWQKLEEENREFFRSYHLRLMVKDQIMRFNQLLERQVELVRQICPSGTSTISMSNPAQIQSLHQPSICHPPAREHAQYALKPENMHAPINANIYNLYSNGASPLQPCLETAANMPLHANRTGLPSNMLPAQTSNIDFPGGMHGLNGGMHKAEAGFPGHCSLIFGAATNVLDSRSTIGDASISSFSNVESNSRLSNQTVIDVDESSIGFLGHIPRTFSLSDLTAGFSNGSDILQNYSRSPFLATDGDNFLDPHGRGEHQDMKAMDTISEGLSYEDFTSD